MISLWGDQGGDASSLVRDVYEAMENETAAFQGVNFERFVWIDVPSPFSLEGFCRQCLACYDFSDHESPTKSEIFFAELCNVIEGLQSKEDWNLIKDRLEPEDTESCIVVIANEEAVAQHCIDYCSWRKIFYEEQEEANNAAIFGPLFAQKVCNTALLLIWQTLILVLYY